MKKNLSAKKLFQYVGTYHVEPTQTPENCFDILCRDSTFIFTNTR